jgi:CRISPR-associated protein Csd1
MVNDFSGFEITQEALEIESLLHAIEVGSEAIPDRHVTMHVLAISPNAARLFVRFFHTGTIGSIIENLIRNRTNMRLAGSVKGSMNLPIWLLLSHTARESKDVSPALAGHLAHSLVAGTPFPETFYSALLRRIKLDRSLDTARVAAIKAFLIHNHGMALTAGLDESRKEEAYHLGRVFACLERAQEDAIPSLNFTIKDRYFSLASVSPGQHFPSLFLKSQQFMAKLEGGRRVYAEKRIKMIMANVSSIPAHLSILEQGIFIVGYYHQRQVFFTKKSDTSTLQSDSNTDA